MLPNTALSTLLKPEHIQAAASHPSPGPSARTLQGRSPAHPGHVAQTPRQAGGHQNWPLERAGPGVQSINTFFKPLDLPNRLGKESPWAWPPR